MLQTPLHTIHRQLGAKLVPFAGWEMPLSYRGILDEHKAVRTDIGLFDVSHMGRIGIHGADAERFLDWIGTNRIAGRDDGAAIYTVLCRDDGTAVDDAIVLRHSSTACSLVANAANRSKVFEHLQKHASGWQITCTAPPSGEGIVALQGPRAMELATRFVPAVGELLPMHACTCSYAGGDLIVARTGYTGEAGCECYGPSDQIVTLWQQLTAAGAMPAGLGARDTLRLEMGYALYGHELDDTIAPTESVARWTVKWQKGPFLGREALVALEDSPSRRHQCGLWPMEGIPRAGCQIWLDDAVVGIVTSGGFSPTLKNGIAIVMLKRALPIGTAVTVDIRGHRCPAQLVKLPFLSKDPSVHA